jgi:haloalkane dehalogenase
VVHDWGGPIGLGATFQKPEQLGRVVILNTAAFADTVVPWRIRLCRAPVIGEWLVRGLNGFAGPATWMSVVRPLAPDIKRGFLYPYDSWANRIATHRFVVDIPSGGGTASDRALAEVEAKLGLLRDRPVLILWGGQDFCFNRHYYDRWRQLLPAAATRYFEEAGHYVLEDEPNGCLWKVRAHLT